MSSLAGRILLLAALLLPAGCVNLAVRKGESPLAAPQMSPDSCALDIFFIRFPFNDPQVNGLMWREIDEQHFPAQLRQRLVRNGFRVGLVSGQMPIALSKLMELGDKPAASGELPATEPTEFADQPRVLRRHLQLPAGRRSEIVTSGVYDRLPVLICEAGQLGGQTYHQAQTLLALRTFPQDDGRVRLELMPELHHGEPSGRWVGNQAMMRLETQRPRRVFDEMAVSATLSPGAMLVISSLPQRPGSLGHHFFTEDGERLEQKLLVIRLSQTQHDELSSPPPVLPLEEDL